jgi:hypothetical protein
MLLKTQVDWPRWLAVIQTKANHNEIWDHIKPILDDNKVRQELRKPSPLIVKTYITAPDDVLEPTIKLLTADQLKRYKINYKIYKNKLKE